MTAEAPPVPVFAPSDAERAVMLAGVEKLIVNLVRKSGLPQQEHEDAEQDARMWVWEATKRFDPARGVRFSTYVYPIVAYGLSNKRVAEQSRPDRGYGFETAEWDRVIGGRSDPNSEADEDEGADLERDLHRAVQRQLTQGLLDNLGDATRTLVEKVAIEGLSAAQVAEQSGHPVKVTKLNLKNALKALDNAGLVSHVASPAEVARVVGPRVPKSPRSHQPPRCSAKVREAVAKLARESVDEDLLSRLPAGVANVMRMLTEGKVTIEQAAGLMGCSTSKVSMRLHNAVRSLRTAATTDQDIRDKLCRIAEVTDYPVRLLRLKPDTRAVVELIRGDGATVAQVAALLGVSLKSATIHAQRAIQTLSQDAAAWAISCEQKQGQMRANQQKRWPSRRDIASTPEPVPA